VLDEGGGSGGRDTLAAMPRRPVVGHRGPSGNGRSSPNGNGHGNPNGNGHANPNGNRGAKPRYYSADDA
jgi:hypothetical protein